MCPNGFCITCFGFNLGKELAHGVAMLIIKIRAFAYSVMAANVNCKLIW